MLRALILRQTVFQSLLPRFVPTVTTRVTHDANIPHQAVNTTSSQTASISPPVVAPQVGTRCNRCAVHNAEIRRLGS